MGTTFPRAFAMLARPSALARRLLGVALVFLGLWTAWLLLGRVSVYATSTSARIEAHGALHPLAARAVGRVTAVHRRAGESLQAGEIVLELDAGEERRHLDRERAQLSSLLRQLGVLGREIGAEGRSANEADAAAGSGADEARQRYQEALAAARLAGDEAERGVRLHQQGLLPETEYQRLEIEAEKTRAVAEALKSGGARANSDRAALGAGRAARRAELERLVASLEGQRDESEAAVAAASEAVEKRLIRAPVAGRLEESADIQVGAFLQEGARIGALLEPAELEIVGQFEPAQALGRIRIGQAAQMRLNGFPWTQYGTVRAIVTSAAGELRDEHVRVALRVDPARKPPVALQHGLPGVVEVEIERASPATLVLRWAGALVAPVATNPQ